MNLDELRAAQSKERQTDSLQHLRESFYEEAADYIAKRQAERERAADAATDPFASPEVRQLTDEIETAREVVEAIYERRLGKLVKSASLAAANIPTDEDGLTMEERALFDDLVERIEENKSRVLDVLDDGRDDDPPAETEGDQEAVDPGRDAFSSEEAASVAGPPDENRDASAPDQSRAEATETSGPPGEASAATDGTPSHEETQTSGAGTAGASEFEGDGTPAGDGVTGNGTEPAEASPASDADSARDPVDRTTVRVTENVEQFYGLDDREYDLDAEDVVTLPEANAEPLLQRGFAERVE